MLLQSLEWGLSPSEFWSMTMPEWFLIAQAKYEQTPEGRARSQKRRWLEQLEMTDEEWRGRNVQSS